MDDGKEGNETAYKNVRKPEVGGFMLLTLVRFHPKNPL